MEDLKQALASQPTPDAFIGEAWESSEKNVAARQYMYGILDALRFTKAISIETYNHWYNKTIK